MHREFLNLQKAKNTSEKLGRQNGFTVRSTRRNRMGPSNDGTEKRRRSSNFHAQEIEDLLSLIDEEKSIIECKRTDQLTNSCKDKIWNVVSQLFNQKNTTKRSDKQLRSKWETLKKIARKEYASGTISEVSNKVLKIMLSSEGMEINSEILSKLKDEPLSDFDVKSMTDLSEGANEEAALKVKTESQSPKSRKVISSSENSEAEEMVNGTRPGNEETKKIADISTTVSKKSGSDVGNSAIVYESRVLGTIRNKKFRYVDSSLQNFGKIFFRQENRRKIEKHRLEMEILKVELAIKKKQLENLLR